MPMEKVEVGEGIEDDRCNHVKIELHMVCIRIYQLSAQRRWRLGRGQNVVVEVHMVQITTARVH